ncbi:uncharacterized protein BX664DRAFT_345707 [Halteromyces radiatus]|uniref:uncharacterized protein n=1 Tax=Halteromyces radiatus TaxID=101107 RepID=UPI00221E589F|nr:uncharacterized protein BX664DRAFT_345707 [Halteromyces radiatus]KAI8099651.1 hypothetical protein BX664DRAFT_345707 [Halteromyces radiatus]
MLETSESEDDTQQQTLPVPIHPDDAKDKVFTAILKALLKMGNKPSSPKELANVIIQSDYATLGGATPFATVSSRISQHFKRAAQHNPPRPPLLAKHTDALHARKFSYSLAKSPCPSSPRPTSISKPQQKSILTQKSFTSPTTPAGQRTDKRLRIKKHDDLYIYNDTSRKKQKQPVPTPPLSLSPQPKALSNDSNSSIRRNQTSLLHQSNKDDDSDGEHSDYYEKMLKEAAVYDGNLASNGKSSPTPITGSPGQSQQNLFNDNNPMDFYQQQETDQNAWTSDNVFATDFEDPVYVPDASTAHHIPFNIDTPESVPISELDTYFTTETSSTSAISTVAQPASTAARTNHQIFNNIKDTTPSPSIQRPQTDCRSDTNDDCDFFDNDDNGGADEDAIHQRRRQRRHSWPILSHQSLSKDFFNTTFNKNDTHLIQRNKPMDFSSGQDLLLNGSTSSSQTTESEPKNDQVDLQSDESKNTLVQSSSLTAHIYDEDSSSMFIKYDHSNDNDNDIPRQTLSNSSDISLSIASLTELLELMHDQQLNFASLQRLINTTPHLMYLAPTAELVQSLAIHLRRNAASNEKDSQSIVDNMSNTKINANMETILNRFPVLKLILNNRQDKDTTDNQSTSPVMIHTITKTNPTLYITVIDQVAVCVAVLAKTSVSPEYRIMRRLDSDYINGTTLLMAGGIDSERERSVIFSLEKDRIRIRKQKSGLYGTWIPLRRAQELAVTCSIEHRLGPFLDDNIEAHFPYPLPVSVIKRQPTKRILKRQHQPFSWVVDNDTSSSSQSTLDNSTLVFSTNSTITSIETENDDGHLAEMLISSPLSNLKPKAPLLGNFQLASHTEAIEGDTIDISTTTTTYSTDTMDDSEDQGTDTDSEIEEVRIQLKRTRDAAINAIADATDLDDIITKQHPINFSSRKRPSSSSTMDFNERQRSRRIRRLNKDIDIINDIRSSKKRLPINNNTKKSTSKSIDTIDKSKKNFEPSFIKKSASWAGSLSLRRPTTTITNKSKPLAKRPRRSSKSQKTFPSTKSQTDAESSTKHMPNISHSPQENKINCPLILSLDKPIVSLPTSPSIQEDESSDEIDIGGSDFGDDLR